MGRRSSKDKPEFPSFGFRVSRIEIEPETLNPELETIFRLSLQASPLGRLTSY
jgi:hypothetical protein